MALRRPIFSDHEPKISAQQRANVVNNRNESDSFGREAMVLLQERGIQVLCAVTEGVEREHKHNKK